MQKDRNALRAGLFIVISIALVIALVFAIRGGERWVEPTQVRAATFKLTDDIGGLRRGDDVRVGGMKEGKIRGIASAGFDTPQPDDDRVLVTFDLPAKYVLREGASVRIQGTLTGSSWLNIDHLGAGEPVPEGVALVGQPSTMNTLLAAAGSIAPELRPTIQEVRGAVADVRTTTIPKVNDTLDAFKQTGTTATATITDIRGKADTVSGKAGKAMDDASAMLNTLKDIFGDTGGDIRSFMANLNTTSTAFKDKLPPILDKADTTLTKVNDSLDKTSAALVDVRDTAANAKEISASARSILAGNRGRIDAMIASLKVTGDNLKFASSEIRRSPWRLLYKPSKGEMANMNLYDSTRQFAEGANDLNDAAVALRDALADPAARPEQIEVLVKRLDESFNGFKEVEQELWQRVQD